MYVYIYIYIYTYIPGRPGLHGGGDGAERAAAGGAQVVCQVRARRPRDQAVFGSEAVRGCAGDCRGESAIMYIYTHMYIYIDR